MAKKINDEYDIGLAFQAIEDELMASMVRNMKRHRAWEDAEGMHWEQWQALQLKSLEKYKRQNKKRFQGQFKSINKEIESLIYASYVQGGMDQEIKILRAMQRGYKFPHMPQKMLDLLEEMDGKTFRQKASLLLEKYRGRGLARETGGFFKINDRKLDALIQATTNDMQKAETAVLRMANDQYRKVIYNAQVYANTGAGTYEKAVDMATKDFLSAGLNCVEYTNGARHTLSDYADMAIRTASKRAYLQGEGQKRQEWDLHLVIMNKRGNPCPKCLPFVGKVLIDDVWSGGSKADGNYPLMSSAISAGLYHPRCKDGHTTYFPGISTPPDDKFSKQELAEVEEQSKLETRAQYADRQERKYSRLMRHSLDKDNQKRYQFRAEEWKTVAMEGESDIIKAGAISGARNPYGEAADEHAKRYYGLVRKMTTDVEKIAKNTGYSINEIKEIKEFIFMTKHDLGGKEPEYFRPDYMMAESWRRLIDGKPEPHDLTLIKHEIMEKQLMSKGMTQEEAHLFTSQKYNYGKEANEFYGKIKKYKKE